MGGSRRNMKNLWKFDGKMEAPIGENHNIPLGFMQIMRNRLVWKKHENESPKVLKIGILALRGRIFRILVAFLSRWILKEFLVKPWTPQNPEKCLILGSVVVCVFFSAGGGSLKLWVLPNTFVPRRARGKPVSGSVTFIGVSPVSSMIHNSPPS